MRNERIETKSNGLSAGVGAKLLIVLALLLSASMAQAAPRQPIGRASGSLGNATVDGQPLTIGTPVFEGSRIVTGATDAASVLLNSKVVLKFDSNTNAVLSEAKGTHVKLEQGNVEVFVAKRLPGQGAVALSDPDATIEALGTVFAASYTPADRKGWYCALESTRPQGVTVRGSGDDTATGLPAGQHVATLAGKVTAPPRVTDPGELKRRLGRILDLDAAMNKRAGTRSRQQTALVEFRKVGRQVTGLQFNAAAGMALADASQSRSVNDAVQFGAVNGLVAGGGFSGGSSGGGGSTAGFSNVALTLGSGNVLRFNLFDNGTEDGDNVSLRVTGSGKTFLARSTVTLANAGEVFAPVVTPGIVVISFTALNEGTLSPNTGGLTLLDTVTKGSASQAYNLTTGKSAVLRILARKP